ncbi:MAG: VWA domain-containing protein [Armatimonadetes bacterium]|nr:VWA domain-containing protein [Armatimonadota bacterium]
MPILNTPTLDTQALPTGQYGYSATRLDALGAAEYTLVTIVTDVSGSVAPFRKEMEGAIQEIVQACRYSPRADNLLIRLVLFDDTLQETHGFKLLQECNPKDYRKVLKAGGSTALYDAAENAVAATTGYGRQLTDADFGVNAILFVLTDGMDNASTLGVAAVRDRLVEAVTSEALESLVSVLVGVNVQDQTVGGYLQDFKTEAGFTQYVEIGHANAGTLSKLAEFVSRSISAQSQALGTGGASQTLTF